MEAKGVMIMELTMGSKMMATAFYIINVEGNYSVIFGSDSRLPLHSFYLASMLNPMERPLEG
jgi:hypothetical protein